MTDPRNVRRILDDALATHRRTHPHRRHAAEVTSDRLGDAVTKWGDRFSGEELDMVARIRQRLEEIAEGETD
jgi:hypothetical protein